MNKGMIGRVVLMVGLLAAVVGVGSAMAADEKNFGVRLRGVYVMPNETFDSRLSALNPQIESAQIPLLDLEYFFTPNLSAEAIAGVTRNDIRLNGDLVGTTWLLPPSVTVKYHPLAGKTVSPYLGAGVNYTLPFKSDLNGVDDFEIDNSFGWVAQAGVDVHLVDQLYFNLDYKYIRIETEATIGGTKYDLEINPSLFGAGVGYRF